MIFPIRTGSVSQKHSFSIYFSRSSRKYIFHVEQDILEIVNKTRLFFFNDQSRNMEPVFVEKLDERDVVTKTRNDMMEEPESKLYTAVEELRLSIVAFKKKLFNIVVSNNTQYNASSMGAMMGFHALFLQCIGYWISLLNNNLACKPIFTNSANSNEFMTLTNNMLNIKKYSSDAKTLLYTMLFTLSTQHPYDLGQPKKADLE